MSEGFKRCEREELGSGELSEIIHQFHQGPARELWVRYNTPHLETAVAFAITTGCWLAARSRVSCWSISAEPCGSTKKDRRRHSAADRLLIGVTAVL